MSGLSHTPGKRARGKTLRGFESRLLRQRIKARKIIFCGPLFFSHRFQDLARTAGWPCPDFTIVIAEVINAETSVILLGTINVVVASPATLE